MTSKKPCVRWLLSRTSSPDVLFDITKLKLHIHSMLERNTLTENVRFSIFFLLVSMCVLAVAMHVSLPRINNKILHTPDSEETSVISPVMHLDTPGMLSFTLQYRASEPTQIRIYSSPCFKKLTINDRGEFYNLAEKCDLGEGMLIELAPYLKEGVNNLRIETDRLEFLQVAPVTPDNYGFTFMRILVVISICALVLVVMYRLLGEWLSGIIIAGGLLVFLHYFMRTHFMHFTHDMPAHLEYIVYVANHWSIPNPKDGWTFYHAPLYYCIQALILYFANWLGSFDPLDLLRLFSALCFLTFVIFSALTLRLLVLHRWGYFPVLALLVFLPSGIITSSRLDSHLLYYSFYAAAIYFLLRWIQKEEIRYLAISLAVVGFALATRSNAFLLFPIITVAAIYKWKFLIRHRRDLYSTLMVAGLLVLCAGLAINKGRSYYYNKTVYSNVHKLPDMLKLTNTSTSLLFNMEEYLDNPYLDTWHDGKNRQYFWNALLKTSLFGEFWWKYPEIANFLSRFLLWMLFCFTVGIIFQWRYLIALQSFWISNILLWIPIALLMWSRWNFPYATTQDFRYIYPALVGFCGINGLIIESCLSRRALIPAFLFISSIIIFMVTSLAYIFVQ